jgi:prepilin-type N-terminal cleavage/methylation domain-containing protein
MKTMPHLIPGSGPVIPGQTSRSVAGRRQLAFTLVEIMVAMAIMAISFVSLYAGLTTGVQVIKLARENLRATQLLVEKMETIRIKPWSEVTNGVSVPGFFEESFYPPALGCKGITYYGTVTITTPKLYTNYEEQMRQVTVVVRWTNSSVLRVREMSTYVANNGMQNYVF